MGKLLMTMLAVAYLGACAVSDDVDPPTSDQSSAISQIIGEKFDGLVTGNIDGQNGWVGNCVVTDGTLPNKYLKCVGDRSATKSVGLHEAGSYTFLVDLSPNINVVNSTHGKISLEGPQGRVFQVIVGCDNIRVAFQMNGPTLGLASFPCQSLTAPPQYRVVCNWSTSGRVLSCGAAKLPQDPTTFTNLALPGPLRPFDSVAIMTFALPGASLFDKVYIWQN